MPQITGARWAEAATISESVTPSSEDDAGILIGAAATDPADTSRDLAILSAAREANLMIFACVIFCASDVRMLASISASFHRREPEQVVLQIA